MRLDLRILLAYLDGRLDAAQAKALGPKIEQSAAARQVIKRIREVISRRDLTIPVSPGRGSAIDANTISEFLDGVLPPNRSTEIEEVCLASNRYLAEMASCHQILGLVGKETATPDPSISRRMAGLVKDTKPVQAAQFLEPSAETQRQPRVRIRRWRLRGGVAAALIVLSVLIAGGYYFFHPPTDQVDPGPYRDFESPPKEDRAPQPPPALAKTEPKPLPRLKPPSAPQPKDRLEVGKAVSVKDAPGVLLQRPDDNQPWQVLPLGSPAFAGDQLLCLAGFSEEVELNSGVRLRLQGNLPDGSPFLESAVMLQSSPGLDLDLALLRGRIAVANNKPQGSAKVRARFLEEVWEFELKEPESAVALEFWSVYPPGFLFRKTGPAEEPMAGLNLFVLKGKVLLKIRYDTHDLQGFPGSCFFTWNNLGAPSRRASSLAHLPLWTSFPSRLPEEARTALDELQKSIEAKRAIEPVLTGALHDSDPLPRVLGISGLGAVDSLAPLLEVWADHKQPAGVRQTATAALRHWMCRNAGQNLRLYRALESKYSAETAETLMILLHGFSQKQALEPASYQSLIAWLKHEQLPVRELAFAQLFALVPEGRTIAYDPAGDVGQRERAFQEWKKLIPDGQLPPKNAAKK